MKSKNFARVCCQAIVLFQLNLIITRRKNDYKDSNLAIQNVVWIFSEVIARFMKTLILKAVTRSIARYVVLLVALLADVHLEIASQFQVLC